jgi:peptidoglycan/LPS O-acetylase OafA/YrhL
MTNNKVRKIAGTSSVFLDVLRICASFIVLYIHAFAHWFPSKVHPNNVPGEPSHAGVIVFFVLSGYVIAHTTLSNNRGGMQYAQARFTRLASVVIPALLVTAICQFLIGHINPQILIPYSRLSRSFTSLRYILSALFINEIWFFSATPLLNVPLWSLSFEFWYYVIFGLWFYRKPGWKSLILPLLACLLCGPKILLLLPVWVSGYLAYRLPRFEIDTSKAWFLSLLFLFAAWLAVTFLPAIPYVFGTKPYYFAAQFVTDWIIGFFIAAALWMLPLGSSFGAGNKFPSILRKIADLTFPLYVLHFPLFILWICLFGCRQNDAVQFWEAIISVVFVSALIGIILEKQRFLWTIFFKFLMNVVNNTILKNSPKGSGLQNPG